ncbi:MAG: DUF1236 domain-containing protein [Phyllobacteriaceae bacterium]|nr:DUF1236 domain-containing protein [Phyllobacteriaceae bacterium]
MKNIVISTAFATVLVASLATPSMADQSGGAVGGAAAGAVGGAIVGGPVGAVIGGVAGAVGGAALGTITEDDEVWIRDYVAAHPHATVTVEEPIVVGKPLPREVTVYEIDGNPRFTEYRYAYVNGNYLLVDRDGNVVGTIVN